MGCGASKVSGTGSASEENGAMVLPKVLIVGAPGVGKTCLASRYMHNVFPNPSPAPTRKVDIHLQRIIVSNETDFVELWDVPGDSSRRHCGLDVRSDDIAGADAVVVVVDLSNLTVSSEIAVGWGDSLRSMDEQVFSCLLGNKADLVDGSVSKEGLPEPLKRCLSEGIFSSYESVSALSGDGVHSCMKQVFSAVREKRAALAARISSAECGVSSGGSGSSGGS